MPGCLTLIVPCVPRRVVSPNGAVRPCANVRIALEARARRIREHASELAVIDAVDAGNAVAGMEGDMHWAADSLEYFAGLVTEIKGGNLRPRPAPPESDPTPAVRCRRQAERV